MAANTDPIYSLAGDVSTNGTTGMSQMVLNAANDYTGIDADVTLCFTADATNGGYVQRIRFKAGGTNIPSMARIYINNGSDHTVATNNAFYGEVTLPATTAIATAATLNPGFKIYFGLGTAVAAGWCAVVIGGKF